MKTKLFQEYYDDHEKVLDQVAVYVMKSGRAVTDIAHEIGISHVTLRRLIEGTNKPFLSTWCKLKKFMADKV